MANTMWMAKVLGICAEHYRISLEFPDAPPSVPEDVIAKLFTNFNCTKVHSMYSDQLEGKHKCREFSMTNIPKTDDERFFPSSNDHSGTHFSPNVTETSGTLDRTESHR